LHTQTVAAFLLPHFGQRSAISDLEAERGVVELVSFAFSMETVSRNCVFVASPMTR
jgi:hypothetical protein